MFMVMHLDKNDMLIDIAEFESEKEACAWVEHTKKDYPESIFDVYDEDANDIIED
jgi:hypothetical protein